MNSFRKKSDVQETDKPGNADKEGSRGLRDKFASVFARKSVTSEKKAGKKAETESVDINTDEIMQIIEEAESRVAGINSYAEAEALKEEVFRKVVSHTRCSFKAEKLMHHLKELIGKKIDEIYGVDQKSQKEIKLMKMLGRLQTKYNSSADMVFLYGESDLDRSLLKNITVELTFHDGKIITFGGMYKKCHITIPGKLIRAATSFSIKYRNIIEESGEK